MANYATLKAAIAAVIKQNGNNEITGTLLQQQLLAMVNSLGADYQFAGIADPTTNPGTPDQNVFYIASEPGTYANFGNLIVGENEVAVLKWNGSWTKQTTGAATSGSVNLLGQNVNSINTNNKSLLYLTPDVSFEKFGTPASYGGAGNVFFRKRKLPFNHIGKITFLGSGYQIKFYKVSENNGVASVQLIATKKAEIGEIGEIDVDIVLSENEYIGVSGVHALKGTFPDSYCPDYGGSITNRLNGDAHYFSVWGYCAKLDVLDIIAPEQTDIDIDLSIGQSVINNYNYVFFRDNPLKSNHIKQIRFVGTGGLTSFFVITNNNDGTASFDLLCEETGISGQLTTIDIDVILNDNQTIGIAGSNGYYGNAPDAYVVWSTGEIVRRENGNVHNFQLVFEDIAKVNELYTIVKDGTVDGFSNDYNVTQNTNGQIFFRPNRYVGNVRSITFVGTGLETKFYKVKLISSVLASFELIKTISGSESTARKLKTIYFDNLTLSENEYIGQGGAICYGVASGTDCYVNPGNKLVVYRDNEPDATHWFEIEIEQNNVAINTMRLNDLRGMGIKRFDISESNTTTFIGAMNTIIRAVYALKPKMQFLITAPCEAQNNRDSRFDIEKIVSIQKALAFYWGMPFFDIRFASNLYYHNSGEENCTEWMQDGIHITYPFSGDNYTLNHRVARCLANQIKYLWSEQEWQTKKILWIGTSLESGFPSVVGNSYPNMVAEILGCSIDNKSIAGGIVRWKKADGTIITGHGSMTNPNDSTNYYENSILPYVDQYDLIVISHGMNDFVLDNTDFNIEDWNLKG